MMERYLLLFSLAVFLLFTVFISSSAYAVNGISTREELIKTCASLMESDLEGRILEPFVGKYVRKKSHEVVESGIPSSYSSVLTLMSEEGIEITFNSPKVTGKKFKNSYEQALENYFYNSEKDTDAETFGICFYQITGTTFVYLIDTLTTIKE